MRILKFFLDSYERDVKGWIDFDNSKGSVVSLQAIRRPIQDILEGFVFETETETLPLLLAVIEKQKKTVRVALMCDCWELATEKDVFVSFPHPIRNFWIVETDITYDFPPSMLENFSLAGKLNKDDLEIVKKAIGGESIQPYKRGRGYNDQVHRKFKEIEKERISAFFRTFTEKQEKGECVIIKFSPAFKEFVELGKETLMVASSRQDSFETKSLQGFFIPDENKIVLLFKENFYGRRGKLKIKINGSPVEIYRGTLKDMEIKNASREIFEVIKSGEVELDNAFISEKSS